MPTERFRRLPKEKVEAIRMAAVREFMRVSPDEASINRIARDAEISRGSFYTYFADKMELLKWIIGDKIRECQLSYLMHIEEVNGDIWDTLEWEFRYSLERIFNDGFVDIMGNLVECSAFHKFLKQGMNEENAANKDIMNYFEKLYQSLDKGRFPIERQMFYDLMETHSMIFMMALRRFHVDKMPLEQVEEYYIRHIRMLRYGVCPAAEHGNKERQKEKKEV